MKPTNTSQIRQDTARRLKEHSRLGESLISLRGRFVMGWLDLRYTECRKGNCKCTQGQKHGPFLYARLKLKGKSVYRYVGKPEDGSLVRKIKGYQEFRTKLAALRKLQRVLDVQWKKFERSLLERPGR